MCVCVCVCVCARTRVHVCVRVTVECVSRELLGCSVLIRIGVNTMHASNTCHVICHPIGLS